MPKSKAASASEHLGDSFRPTALDAEKEGQGTVSKGREDCPGPD